MRCSGKTTVGTTKHDKQTCKAFVEPYRTHTPSRESMF